MNVENDGADIKKVLKYSPKRTNNSMLIIKEKSGL
jgi:hypothetical protein